MAFGVGYFSFFYSGVNGYIDFHVILFLQSGGGGALQLSICIFLGELTMKHRVLYEYHKYHLLSQESSWSSWKIFEHKFLLELF